MNEINIYPDDVPLLGEDVVVDSRSLHDTCNGRVYGLSHSGYAIVGLMDGANTVDDIVRNFIRFYNVDVSEAWKDVLDFLTELNDVFLLSWKPRLLSMERVKHVWNQLMCQPLHLFDSPKTVRTKSGTHKVAISVFRANIPLIGVAFFISFVLFMITVS